MDKRLPRRLAKLEAERQADAAYKVQQIIKSLDDESVARLLTGDKTVREEITASFCEDFDVLLLWAAGGEHALKVTSFAERSRCANQVFGDAFGERRSRVVQRIKELREQQEGTA